MATGPIACPLDGTSGMKIMFVVTHLLGSGHLSRTLTLARAFQAAGHSPIVVSGGMPAPHLEHDDLAFVQLPPLRSDGTDFSRFLDVNAKLAGSEVYAARSQQLIDIFQRNTPGVLITELFPFGRRNLRAEFTALLNAARTGPKPPLILTSIRDILAPPSKPAKVAFVQEMIANHYDGVLVHADADLVPLSLSWPVDEALSQSLRYTGFVAPPPAPPHPEQAGHKEIIVSAGGGNVGRDVFDCAKQAASQDPGRVWRLLIGGTQAAENISLLKDGAPPNLVVQAARPDFRQMLHHAGASVSMCGYNTALDILQTSCPAVFVPFDAGNEVEQSLRAAALQKMDGIEVLKAGALTAEKLRQTVDAVVLDRARLQRANTDGAGRSVEIVEHMLEQRR